MGHMMVELLLIFLLSLSLIGAVSAGLIGEIAALQNKAADYESAGRAEALVRYVEAALCGGANVDGGLWEEDASWRLESNRLRMWHESGVVEIRGVFCDDESEPV